jgi:hypothetical protein
MSAKVHRKFSTIPRESLWWRAKVTTDDVQWVRKHLGRSLDGIKEFRVVPSSSGFTAGPLFHSWNRRVVFVENETAPHVQVPIGERYDYRRDYENAKRKSDPYLSPHGLFRKLENGYHMHALQFMQQFGSLNWKLAAPVSADWVSLSDFWDRHARFVGVSMLWEARSDDQLKQAWQWIYQRRDQINRVGPAPFGYVPLWNEDSYSPPPQPLPWEREEGVESEASDFFADCRILRECSLEVIQNELNMHTADCRQIWMMTRIGNASEDVAFRPTRGFSSLWGAIWDLLGQDTSGFTHSWRECLECGRLFYPKDRRSACCTTEHQSLWSKR